MFYKMTIDEIRADLENLIDYNERAAQAWKNAKINKTKTGAEFVQIGRAVENCKTINEYGFDRLMVFFSTKRKMHERDTIDIYGYIDELPADDPRREGRAMVSGCVRVKYIKNADEIREAIKKRVEYCEKAAADYADQLAKAEEATKAYRKAVAAAEEALAEKVNIYNKIGSHYANSHLYYSITETR